MRKKDRMKKITIILIIFASVACHAQTAPTIEWQNCLGGNNADVAFSISQTTDGGFIVAGQSDSNDGDVSGHHGTPGDYSFDYWVVKLDSSGGIQWQKCLGGSDNDVARSISQTTDGGFIVAGDSYSNDGDVSGHHGTPGDYSADYWVVKLNSSGGIQWQKSLGGSDDDVAWSIFHTTDGGFIVAGQSGSNDGDVSGLHGSTYDFDYWVVKLDSSGGIQWQKCLGGSNGDVAFSISQANDSGFIVAGDSYSNDGDVSGHHGSTTNFDYWVVKLDSMGGIQWQKCLGGSGNDYARSISPNSDGGFIVAGYSSSHDGDVSGHHGTPGDYSVDYWVVKLNSLGGIQWQKCLGGSGNDHACSISPSSDGGFIVAGYSSSHDGDVSGWHVGYDGWGSPYYDDWVVKLNSSGDIKWQKCLGGSNSDKANSGEQTTDGGFILAGCSDSNDGDVSGNHGSGDFWVVKLSPEDGIEENSSSMKPQAFALSTHPNPFNSALTINIDAHVGAIHELPLRIEIFDIAGRRVSVIARPEAAAISSNQGDCFVGQSPSRNDAKTEFIWQPDESLGSGVYLVRVRFDSSQRPGEGQTVTKRVVYLK